VIDIFKTDDWGGSKEICVMLSPLFTGHYAEASRITGTNKSIPLQNFSHANV